MPTSKIDPDWLADIGRKTKDRHSSDTVVISIRIDTGDYYQLLELIARSPLPHDSVGGYLLWLIQTEALRRR